MTELDKFQPEGEPIHPYDVFDLMVAGADINRGALSPWPVDEDDYRRNLSKVGIGLAINGQPYFESCHVAYRSTSFDKRTAHAISIPK